MARFKSKVMCKTCRAHWSGQTAISPDQKEMHLIGSCQCQENNLDFTVKVIGTKHSRFEAATAEITKNAHTEIEKLNKKRKKGQRK